MKGQLFKRGDDDYKLFYENAPIAQSKTSPYNSLLVKNCDKVFKENPTEVLIEIDKGSIHIKGYEPSSYFCNIDSNTSDKGRLGVVNGKVIYPKKLQCKNCNKETPHRPKLDAIKNDCLVCSVCDVENKITTH